MHIEDFGQLPEAVTLSQLERFYEEILSDLRIDSKELSLNKLHLLGEAQWRTRDRTPDSHRHVIESWFISNWEDTDEFLFECLYAGVAFGLTKKFFKRALKTFNLDERSEFEKALVHSQGEFIDPYHSLKSQK